MRAVRFMSLTAAVGLVALLWAACGDRTAAPATPTTAPTAGASGDPTSPTPTTPTAIAIEEPEPSPTPLSIIVQEESGPPQRTIVVEGVGEASVKLEPDIAVVSLGYTIRRSSMHGALDRAEEVRRIIRGELLKLGVSEEDIDDGSVYASQEYRGARYEARRELVFRLPADRNVSHKVGVVTDQLLETLVESREEMGSVNVSYATEGRASAEAEAEARRNAIADAKTKAEQIADEAGLTLGEVMSVSEVPPKEPAPGGCYYYSCQQGRTEISVTVSVTFAVQ